MEKDKYELCKKDFDGRHDGMRVKDLKKILQENNLPDDALVFIQRVQDVYYDKHNWSTLKKEVTESYGKHVTEYTPAWWPVIYKDDENLYIDLHY